MQISKKRLEELENKERKLQALENGGVDNWEWYDEALNDYREYIEKKEKINQIVDQICEIVSLHAEQPAGQGAGYGVDVEGQDKIHELITKHLE